MWRTAASTSGSFSSLPKGGLSIVPSFSGFLIFVNIVSISIIKRATEVWQILIQTWSFWGLCAIPHRGPAGWYGREERRRDSTWWFVQQWLAMRYNLTQNRQRQIQRQRHRDSCWRHMQQQQKALRSHLTENVQDWKSGVLVRLGSLGTCTLSLPLSSLPVIQGGCRCHLYASWQLIKSNQNKWSLEICTLSLPLWFLPVIQGGSRLIIKEEQPK